ncbi:MAG: MFS transporter, partial [Thermoplasmata archaeon]|nr:MFS transporter [Thermoplasmata archaeon]
AVAGRPFSLAPPSLCDAAHAHDSGTQAPSRLYFGLVAFVFFVIIAGGGLPTPLYVVYQKLWGFSPTILTAVFAAYAFGLLITLLLFRRLSDRFGRKKVLLAGVLVALVSTLVFLGAQNVTWLILGRILSGVSVGLTASTASAALTEFEPNGNRRRATQWITVITALGVGIGPFYAGFLVQYGPDPLTLSFWVLVALLLAALLATLLVRERPRPRQATAGGAARRFQLPVEVRPVFLLSALAAFVGFALAGIFSGLTPSFLGSDLHVTNHAFGGATVLLMFGSAAVAQLSLERWDRRRVMRAGGALVPLGLVTIATAVWTGLAAPFFLGTVLCGAGFGLCLMGGLGLLNQVAPPDRRGEVLSEFYVAAYLGLSVPVVGIGVLGTAFGLPAAVVALSVIISLLSAPVILARGPRTSPVVPPIRGEGSSKGSP